MALPVNDIIAQLQNLGPKDTAWDTKNLQWNFLDRKWPPSQLCPKKHPRRPYKQQHFTWSKYWHQTFFTNAQGQFATVKLNVKYQGFYTFPKWMQHIWSKTLLAITHGRIPPFWINFQRLTKSLHPNHQLLLSSSFFNVDRFLLQITNSTEGLLSTAVLTQIIPAPQIHHCSISVWNYTHITIHFNSWMSIRGSKFQKRYMRHKKKTFLSAVIQSLVKFSQNIKD